MKMFSLFSCQLGAAVDVIGTAVSIGTLLQHRFSDSSSSVLVSSRAVARISDTFCRYLAI